MGLTATREGPFPRQPRILAVDGTGMLVRCHRASLRSAQLSTGDGTPTGAVMMFIGSLSRKVRAMQPAYLVMAWDAPGGAPWRRELYPEYKANRAGSPAKGPEAAQASEFCEAAGIRQLMVPEFEADDILAAVQRQARQEMPEAMLDLCSDDADVLQLLGDGQVAVTGLATDAIVTEMDVVATWGVAPRLLPMLRSLSGDGSDNIPGLKGVGPYRAAQMMARGALSWPLPRDVIPDPDDYDRVRSWQSVMDLVTPPRRPEDVTEKGYFALKGHTEWNGGVSDPMRAFLERYELRALHKRLLEGRLW